MWRDVTTKQETSTDVQSYRVWDYGSYSLLVFSDGFAGLSGLICLRPAHEDFGKHWKMLEMCCADSQKTLKPEILQKHSILFVTTQEKSFLLFMPLMGDFCS